MKKKKDLIIRFLFKKKKVVLRYYKGIENEKYGTNKNIFIKNK